MIIRTMGFVRKYNETCARAEYNGIRCKRNFALEKDAVGAAIQSKNAAQISQWAARMVTTMLVGKICCAGWWIKVAETLFFK